MRTPESYMRVVLEIAEQSLAEGEFPIAAIVVLNDEVIASAHTCEMRERRFLVHAELLALEQADKLWPFPGNREDAILFTNLEPCLMCMGAAMSFFLGHIYYGLESPADGAVELVQSWTPKQYTIPSYKVPNIHGGLLREESKELFQRYAERYSSGPMWEWAKSLAELP